MRRILVPLSIVALLVGVLAAAPAAPESSSNCTPLVTPRVCLYINGSGLHVDNFFVTVHFIDIGRVTKGKFAVRNGGPNGAIIEISGIKTYTEDGDWHGLTFQSGVNFPNNTVLCGEFIYVSGHNYSGDRPCGTVHS